MYAKQNPMFVVSGGFKVAALAPSGHVRLNSKGSGALLWLGLLPFLLLLVTSGAARIQDICANLSSVPDGSLSRSEIVQRVQAIGPLFAGEKLTGLEMEHRTGFAHRWQDPVIMWEVRAQSRTEQYVIRVNAQTGRIFGINTTSQQTAHKKRSPLPLAVREKAAQTLLTRLIPQSRIVCRLNMAAAQELLNHEVGSYTFLVQLSNGRQATINVTVDTYEGRLLSFAAPPQL